MMDQLTNFVLLKDIVKPLYVTVQDLVYWKLLLPAFALAIVITYFNLADGTANFLDCVKRLVICLLLLVAFPEIQDAIVNVSNYIAEVIGGDKRDFFKRFFTTGVEAGKESLKNGSLLNFPNLIISVVAFLSWILAYVVSFLMVAIRQFMWVVLTVLAPLLILCNLYPATSHITKGLFRGLIELSCWLIYWTILEQILHTMGYVELTGAGDWFITMALNLVVACAMIATPFAVKAIMGGSATAISGALKASTLMAPVGAGARMLTSLAKAKAITTSGYQVAKRGFQGVSNYITPKAVGDPSTGSVKHTLGSRFVKKLGIHKTPIRLNQQTPPTQKNPSSRSPKK